MNLFDNISAKAWRVGALFGLHSGDRIGRFATSEFSEHDRNQSDLHRLFYGNDGPIVHKWKHYLSIYDKHLSRFRGKPFRLLEIGVFKGGSMRLWRQYFGPEAVIFGIDIDAACVKFDGQDAQVRIGSQDDLAFLDRVVSEMGGIDVVIDDGSHLSPHQIASFRHLFPKLNQGGIYICEDLHTNYWRGPLEGGYRRASTFIELAKRGVDDMHADFHTHAQRIAQASRSIKAIHFYHCMIVIEKAKLDKPTHVKTGF